MTGCSGVILNVPPPSSSTRVRIHKPRALSRDEQYSNRRRYPFTQQPLLTLSHSPLARLTKYGGALRQFYLLQYFCAVTTS